MSALVKLLIKYSKADVMDANELQNRYAAGERDCGYVPPRSTCDRYSATLRTVPSGISRYFLAVTPRTLASCPSHLLVALGLTADTSVCLQNLTNGWGRRWLLWRGFPCRGQFLVSFMRCLFCL